MFILLSHWKNLCNISDSRPLCCNLTVISEINECETNPCYPFGKCTDLIGDYNCTCNPGYEANDTKSCIGERLCRSFCRINAMFDEIDSVIQANCKTVSGICLIKIIIIMMLYCLKLIPLDCGLPHSTGWLATPQSQYCIDLEMINEFQTPRYICQLVS